MQSDETSKAQEWFAKAEAHGISEPRYEVRKVIAFFNDQDDQLYASNKWKGLTTPESRPLSDEDIGSAEHAIELSQIPMSGWAQPPIDLISTVDGSEVRLEFSSSDDKLYLLAFWNPTEFTSKTGIHFLDGFLGRNPQWTDKIEVVLISVGRDAEAAQKFVASKAWTHFKSFIFKHEHDVAHVSDSNGVPGIRFVRYSDFVQSSAPTNKWLSKLIEEELRDPQAELSEEQQHSLVPQVKETLQQFMQENPQAQGYSAQFTQAKIVRPDGSVKHIAGLTLDLQLSSKIDAAYQKLITDLKAAFPIEVRGF
jgi:hypothetical protein